MSILVDGIDPYKITRSFSTSSVIEKPDIVSSAVFSFSQKNSFLVSLNTNINLTSGVVAYEDYSIKLSFSNLPDELFMSFNPFICYHFITNYYKIIVNSISIQYVNKEMTVKFSTLNNETINSGIYQGQTIGIVSN
jgi:hypothetical protein